MAGILDCACSGMGMSPEALGDLLPGQTNEFCSPKSSLVS